MEEFDPPSRLGFNLGVAEKTKKATPDALPLRLNTIESNHGTDSYHREPVMLADANTTYMPAALANL